MKSLFFVTALTQLLTNTKVHGNADYGVDCSFPVHSYEFRCGDLLGDRKSLYEDFMQGCRDYFGPKANLCDVTEEERIAMSIRQPQSMVNYTSTGFKKIRAPEVVRKLLTDHWNKNQANRKQEEWSTGNIYVNHWKAPTYMVSVEDTSLVDAGPALKKAIWDGVKPVIEEWTGMELRPTSMYGIRIYTEGAILSPHADRLPLVSSCIINVAQDVDEPWPLEVFDRHDRAVNVTMEPGDMVLYESGSLVHARPFPLKGKYMANIFIHFEPTGRPLHPVDGVDYTYDSDLPPYILPGSPEVENWKQRNPYGWEKPAPAASQYDSPVGHLAAAVGDVDQIARLARENRRIIHKADRNGWQPIHEAVRAGHKDAVKLLVDLGADMNARTDGGKGATPLNLAIESFSDKHPVSKYLMSLGALNIGPEL